MGLSATDIALIAAGPLNGILNPDTSRDEVASYEAKDARIVVWLMRNLDDGSEIEGQFPPEDPVLNLSNSYGEHTTLNRQNPIIQYLRGNSDTFSFVARFHALHKDDKTPSKQISTLMSWRQRDPTLARPPIVSFTLGNIVPFPEAVITSLGNITYSDPKSDGDIRDVSLRVDLLRYNKYSLSNEPEPETRYHRTRTGDYYEFLSYQEYKNPMLGVLIRRRHPDKIQLTEGDIVKLPSYGAIKGQLVFPISIPFYKSYSTKDTDTKALRQSVFESKNSSYSSPSIPEGL